MLGDIAYITEFFVKWKMLAIASLQNPASAVGVKQPNTADF